MLGLRSKAGPRRSATTVRFTIIGAKGSDGQVTVRFSLPQDAGDIVASANQLLGVLKQLNIALPLLDADLQASASVPGSAVESLIAAGTKFSWTCSDCRW